MLDIINKIKQPLVSFIQELKIPQENTQNNFDKERIDNFIKMMKDELEHLKKLNDVRKTKILKVYVPINYLDYVLNNPWVRVYLNKSDIRIMVNPLGKVDKNNPVLTFVDLGYIYETTVVSNTMIFFENDHSEGYATTNRFNK